MIDRNRLHRQIAAEAEVSFSRSGGKGGQNVNKLNTKALAAIHIDRLTLLSAAERSRLKTKLAKRLNRDGELFVQVQDDRTQSRNLTIAFERLTDLVVAALLVRKKRRKTRTPAGAREERLATKKKHTEKKKMRRTSREED